MLKTSRTRYAGRKRLRIAYDYDSPFSMQYFMCLCHCQKWMWLFNSTAPFSTFLNNAIERVADWKQEPFAARVTPSAIETSDVLSLTTSEYVQYKHGYTKQRNFFTPSKHSYKILSHNESPFSSSMWFIFHSFARYAGPTVISLLSILGSRSRDHAFRCPVPYTAVTPVA